MQEAAELLRQMDPETRMGAKWPLHECCMNVATTSQIIYWLWCFEKEELRISLSTSRILSSSQYHWPWSVYCAAVWLYICTKPRKNPHASEHVSKHVCIEQLRACQSTLNRTKTCDTHIFCWCISHPCQYVNTYCAYIYIHIHIHYIVLLYIYTCPTLLCLYTSLPLYNLQTKDVCHGLAVMELARLRSALGEGFHPPGPTPIPGCAKSEVMKGWT